MSNVKFELDINGLRELMKSAEMKEALQEAGEAVAGHGESMSGEPYGTKMTQGDYTAICQVFPTSGKGVKDSEDNLTALKALSSSGLPLDK